ncbi:MAG: carbohydrate ABC transporter permease [Erysipelotrichaceae bacterium]|jgi:multiple sugar transport system permease protein|nr:carbohydrate ABC transporter permease [Erysipelotrichaceae bacterium]
MNQNLSISSIGSKHHSAKVSLGIYRGFVYFFLIVLVILCLFPIYIILINCTHTNAEIQGGFNIWFGTNLINNITNLFNNHNLPVMRAFFNSLFVSLACAVLTVYFSALTAYAIHTYEFKGKRVVNAFIIAIMMIPTQISAIGLFILCLQLHMTESFIPLILPSIASPITYFYMKQYCDSVLPYEVIEASRVDGASEIRIFHQIVLPMLKPAIALQFIFAYVSSWNNYFIPALLNSASGEHATLPLLIRALSNSSPESFDMGPVYCLMAVAIFPLVIIFIIFSKSIIKGLTSGAVKG